jgi:hypothetical protein
MSFAIPQVFISSTSEFAAERRSLAAAIDSMEDMDFKAYIYEEERPPGTSPEKHCALKMRESELIVLLVGSHFGTTFPNRDSSIVQWEYEYANDLPRPLHPYVKKLPDVAAIDPRQAEFIRGLTDFSKGSWSRIFSNERELLDWSVKDLRKWRLDSWKLHQDSRDDRRRWKDRLLLGAGAVLSIALAAGLVIGLLTDVPASKLGIVLAAGVAALGIIGWLLKKDDL